MRAGDVVFSSINLRTAANGVISDTLYAHIVAVQLEVNGTVPVNDSAKPARGGRVTIYTSDGQPITITGPSYGEAELLHGQLMKKLEEWHRKPDVVRVPSPFIGPGFIPPITPELVEITSKYMHQQEEDNG